MITNLKKKIKRVKRHVNRSKTSPRSIKRTQREYLDIAEATDQLLITEIK